MVYFFNLFFLVDENNTVFLQFLPARCCYVLPIPEDLQIVSKGWFILWAKSSHWQIYFYFLLQLGHGDYSAANTKVLRMVNTLAVDNDAKQTIEALRSELQKTKEKLQAIEELKSQSGINQCRVNFLVVGFLCSSYPSFPYILFFATSGNYWIWKATG